MLKAASWPEDSWRADRLLVAGSEPLAAVGVARLAEQLRAGDLMVINDSGTLPASLWTEDGTLEIRLARRLESAEEVVRGVPLDSEAERWEAILLGRGSWRDATERRGVPPRSRVGQLLDFGPGLRAKVLGECPVSPVLVTLGFDPTGAAFRERLYARARPVQYAYAAREYPLYLVQTPVAARPWSVEMPSAARALRAEVRAALRARGVGLATLTHACGLSSTGDSRIDERLPFPERYEIPAATARAIAETRAQGGRIIAAGTSVTRALESAAGSAGSGTIPAGEGIARLVLSPAHRLRIVDGLLTGMHEFGESHFRLLEAFASPERLARIGAFAAERAFRKHEFGDFLLLFAEAGQK